MRFTTVILRLVLFIGYVPSASMEPTIKAGSLITGYRAVGRINRGDILIFTHHRYMVVKRVAALEGDTIYIDHTGTIISVNEEVQNAARILEVPAGCFFMLGDNTDDSIDSRFWEDPFITRKQIIAKLW